MIFDRWFPKRNGRRKATFHHKLPITAAGMLVTGILSACSILPIPFIEAPTPTSEAISVPTQQTPRQQNTKAPVLANPTQTNSTLTNTVETPTPTPERTETEPAITASPGLTATPENNITPSPQQNSELLFVTEGKLGRWNPVTGQLKLVAVHVQSYSMSADGSQLAILQTKEVTANGVAVFDLLLVDLASGEKIKLLKETPRLYHLSVSQDGQWIAYTSREEGGTIYLLNTESGQPPVEVGICKRELEMACDSAIVWSADGTAIAWSDENGVWQAVVDNPTPRQVISNTLEVIDPRGQATQVEVRYNSLDWSPFGRYLLASVAPTASDVTWRAVIDTIKPRIGQVPGSYQFQTRAAIVTWMPDGSIIAAHPSDPQTDQPPRIERWQVLPTREDLLGHLESTELRLAEITSEFPKDTFVWIDWPTPLSARTIVFGLQSDHQNSDPVLIRYDLKFNLPQVLNQLSFDAERVLFSPELSGAVAIGSEGEIFFAPADGDEPYDLRSILGTEVSGLIWIPAVPSTP